MLLKILEKLLLTYNSFRKSVTFVPFMNQIQRKWDNRKLMFFLRSEKSPPSRILL